MAKAKSKEAPAAGTAEGAAKPGRGKKKLLLLAGVPLLLVGVGGGLWASGLLAPLLGGASAPAASGEPAEAQAQAAAAIRPPAFLDMPEIVANLNAPGRRATFVKLRSKLELSRAEDAGAVQAAMPRLQDLFGTYLREMRPDELRGSAGTHRLREELTARANLAAAPARVTDVLFVEILVQ